MFMILRISGIDTASDNTIFIIDTSIVEPVKMKTTLRDDVGGKIGTKTREGVKNIVQGIV